MNTTKLVPYLIPPLNTMPNAKKNFFQALPSMKNVEEINEMKEFN
jgi:hypothetical protein